MKKATLEGAFVRQILFQGKGLASLNARTKMEAMGPLPQALGATKETHRSVIQQCREVH